MIVRDLLRKLCDMDMEAVVYFQLGDSVYLADEVEPHGIEDGGETVESVVIS